MISSFNVEKIIKERISLHPDDPKIIEKWNELIQIFSKDEEDTIEFLNSCSEDIVSWISEVFEDISEQLQSEKFISCIEELNEKFPSLDLEQEIYYAKDALKY